MSYLDNFFHQIYGPENGRRWVFLHGLMGYGQNWRKIVAGIENTERCLTFDQRGHGRSIKPDFGYDPKDYAEDLNQIINDLGWEKIILVGHSMGGRNALSFANLYPERLSQLVIVDIGPNTNPKALEYYQNLLNLVPTPFANRQAAKDHLFGPFLLSAKTRENPQVIANYFYANLEEKSNGTLDWRFSKRAILSSVEQGFKMDFWKEVKNLRISTMYIRGALSADLTSDDFQRILLMNPMIKGVEIPQAGHWVHADQPQAFITEIKRFVGGF